jgi:shikimate kinase
MDKSRIFLVGFMGAGKSTVGPMLASHLAWDFIDLDQQIEKEHGRTIRQFFEMEGEPQFRRKETEALLKLAARRRCVIALGGGAFVQAANRPILSELGVSVFLDCDLEIILARCSIDGTRPLLQTPDQVKRLLESRLSSYRQCDVCINVSQLTPEQIAKAILENPVIQEQIRTLS